MKRRSFRGHHDYAMDVYRSGIDAGFDLARSGSAEFVHNIIMPFRFLSPELDVPVVPIFINCFASPLPRITRAHAFGQWLSTVIERRAERVCLIASGGQSHWPPYPREGMPLADEIERVAGMGGSEVLMWAMPMGAMHGRKARTLFYEAVKPWMGGVTVAAYGGRSQPVPS